MRDPRGRSGGCAHRRVDSAVERHTRQFVEQVKPGTRRKVCKHLGSETLLEAIEAGLREECTRVARSIMGPRAPVWHGTDCSGSCQPIQRLDELLRTPTIAG